MGQIKTMSLGIKRNKNLQKNEKNIRFLLTNKKTYVMIYEYAAQ